MSGYSQAKSASGPSVSDKVRVYVVGDMSVGKTSLLSVLCEGKVHLSSTWTVGCNIETKVMVSFALLCFLMKADQ